ncbi:MAG: hypothetical protein AAFU49_02820 [Pseudomonadota bacterium]
MLSAGVAAYYLVAFFDIERWERLTAAQDGTGPLTPVHLLLAVDWGAFVLHNWLSLGMAVLSLGLFAWLSAARVWQAPAMGWRITAAIGAANLLQGLTILWALLVVWTALGDVHRACFWPAASGVLSAVYGPVECAVP